MFARNDETICFDQTMNKRMNPMKTDAEVERAQVAALSVEKIEDRNYRTPSGDEGANFGNDVKIIMSIAKYKLEDLILEEADHIYVERIQVKLQVQMKEPLVKMEQPANTLHETRSKPHLCNF